MAEVASLTDALMRKVERGGAILRLADGRAVAGSVKDGDLVREGGAAASAQARESGDLKGWKRELVSRQLREKLEESRAGRTRGAGDDGSGAKKRGSKRKKP